MQFLVLPLVLLSLIQGCVSARFFTSMHDSPQSSNLQPSEVGIVASTSGHSQATDFKLSDHQWQHRVVLLFAPSERSPAYQQQMQAWQANPTGIRDRDLKLVAVLDTGESNSDGQLISPTAAAQLRQRFGVTVGQFAVILVGKDGTEKQRSQTPVELASLFHTIDAMPMRQQEMRSRS